MAATAEKTNKTEETTEVKVADLKKEAAVVEDFLNLPSISLVCFHQHKAGGPITFTFYYSQRKLAANERKTVSLSSTLVDPSNLESFSPVSMLNEIPSAVMASPSPSRKKMFVVKAGEGMDSAVFEINEGPRCTQRLQIPNLLHGTVINDGLFSGRASWNTDETQIAYVADNPPAETAPDWGKAEENDDKSEKDEQGKKAEPKPSKKGWKGQSPWEQSWGEGLTNVKSPSVFVFDLTTSSILSFKGLPENYSFGHPIWTPNNQGIICTGWPHRQSNFKDVALKLGFLYCKNRPCSLFYIPLEAASDDSKKAICLTNSLQSAALPAFSPDGKTLVFFSHEHATQTGIHASLSRLYAMDWSEVENKLKEENPNFTQCIRLVVGDIARPSPPVHFPGIYLEKDNPMSSPFLDNNQLILTTTWKFQFVIISISLSDGKITPLNPIGMSKESYSLLCMKNGVLVATKQSFVTSPCLVARRADAKDDQWTSLPEELQPKLEKCVQEALDNIEQIEITFEPKHYPGGKPESPVPCEAILLKRKDASTPQPTLFIPHGGPHSSVPQMFAPSLLHLSSMGLSVLIVNFRGSTSYGVDFTMALPGYVGEVDVQDCIQAIDAAIKRGYTDPAKIALSGGSHGGFLTGHLVGQFPDKFQCAILRNPCLVLGHMVSITDIPEWVFVECLGIKGREAFSTVPAAELVKKFNEMSPFNYVNQVKTPMMFLLGDNDKRVHPSDALLYIATLRSRKDHPEVRVLYFSGDRHSLDSPQTEYESVMNIIWWLKKHKVLA